MEIYRTYPMVGCVLFMCCVSCVISVDSNEERGNLVNGT